MAPNVKAPKIAKPKTMGSTVPSYAMPISVPKGTAIREDREPTTAAPTPATCPNGSIAKEFRLPNKIPMLNNAVIRKPMYWNKVGAISKDNNQKL